MKRKKSTVKAVVFAYLHRHWHNDTVKFDDVAGRVRKKFPMSKFNPNHLSVYMSQFSRRVLLGHDNP